MNYKCEEFAEKLDILCNKVYGKEECIIFEDFNSNVLLSAPHAIEQLRLGFKKFAEPDTATLAILLHELTNCHAIIKVSNDENDANFDEESIYKTTMKNLVRKRNVNVILDLHCLSPKRKTLINLGIYHGILLQTSEKEKQFDTLVKLLRDRNIETEIDQPFAAKPNTIAYHFGSYEDIFAIQIEINSKIFFEENEKQFALLVDALKQFIDYLKIV